MGNVMVRRPGGPIAQEWPIKLINNNSDNPADQSVYSNATAVWMGTDFVPGSGKWYLLDAEYTYKDKNNGGTYRCTFNLLISSPKSNGYCDGGGYGKAPGGSGAIEYITYTPATASGYSCAFYLRVKNANLIARGEMVAFTGVLREVAFNSAQ